MLTRLCMYAYSFIVFHVFNVFVFYVGLLIVQLCFMTDIVLLTDCFVLIYSAV